ncbi:unnamed protein product [Ambrosiozyma monospora]|uniref:Unnamed protein product n=1 Tax=Ambrosiozyma monospora TaxID=43982 RepID=A0ACB5T3H6_AMBMO|nr:unnamed protein product [Ambrosiozyma monospora]
MDMLTDNGKIPMNPIPMSRKRSHDEDINDLIVSLLDLSHTTPSANALAITTSTSPKTTTSPSISTSTAAPASVMTESTNATTPPSALPLPTITKQQKPKQQQRQQKPTQRRFKPVIAPSIGSLPLEKVESITVEDNLDSFLKFEDNFNIDGTSTAHPSNSTSTSRHSPLDFSCGEDDDLELDLDMDVDVDMDVDTDVMSNTVGGAGTPNTMLSLIKTNETIDSLSGSTLVSNSPKFKLLDLPIGEEDEKRDVAELDGFSIFGNVPSSVFSSNGMNGIGLDLLKGGEGTGMGGMESGMGVGVGGDYYEFGGIDDVEMEFENFINGGSPSAL